jgi:hypothetical protein
MYIYVVRREMEIKMDSEGACVYICTEKMERREI